MTASTVQAGASPASLATPTVLRRAVAAEWTRLWTVRSTWWSLLAGAAMMLFIGIAFGLDGAGDGSAPVWVAGEIGIVFAQFALLIPAMLAVTSEYSTGAIRTTLQAVPRRGVLATARATVTLVVVTLAGVVLALAADVASWIALGSQAEVVAGDWVRSLGSVAVVVAVGTSITLGIGTALRSSAGTLTSLFLLLLVLPAMLPNFGVAWLATIGEHLPGSGTMSFLEAFGTPLVSTTRAVVIVVVWIAAAATAGGWSLLRRDAA